MANSERKPDHGDRLAWKCADIDCTHTTRCAEKVMYADDGNVMIRGEISWNADDRKWDWCVRVDHYGATDDVQHRVEKHAAQQARRMAAQVGMAFRGRKMPGLDDVDD